MASGGQVEACGSLLSLGALDSYKIIYVFGVRTPLSLEFCQRGRPAPAHPGSAADRVQDVGSRGGQSVPQPKDFLHLGQEY